MAFRGRARLGNRLFRIPFQCAREPHRLPSDERGAIENFAGSDFARDVYSLHDARDEGAFEDELHLRGLLHGWRRVFHVPRLNQSLAFLVIFGASHGMQIRPPTIAKRPPAKPM